jgi:YggT family protein
MLFLLLDLYSLALFVRVILSWVSLPPDNPIVRGVERITEPVLAPIRRRLPSAGGFDFSPLVVLIIIRLLKVLLTRL